MLVKILSPLLAFSLSAVVTGQSPNEIYSARVVPLIKTQSDRCSACHFQGIDLKSIFTEDPVQTFVHMRTLGWIDVGNPGQSRILSFLDRHTAAETDLQRRVRISEREAVRDWVEAACKNPSLLAMPIAQHRDLELDTKLIRHTRTDQIELRFTAAIWSQLERCANCHSPDRNQKQVEKHGELMSWIVPNEPLRTLELLRDRKLISLDDPHNSPLRTKPAGLVEHGAGIKFPIDGETDTAWLAFLNDYSKTVRRDYTDSTELPAFQATHRWRSGLHLAVTELPEQWLGKIVIVHLYRIGDDGKVDELPVAYGESTINQERQRWSNSLELLDHQPSDSLSDLSRPIRLEDKMPSGNYELRIAPIDSSLAYATQIDAPWNSGHAAAKSIRFSTMRRLSTDSTKVSPTPTSD